MSLFSMLRRHMLASTGSEACIIGLAITTMIDFSHGLKGYRGVSQRSVEPYKPPGSLLDSGIDIIRGYIWRVRQGG